MQLKLHDLGASLMMCLALMPNPSLNADVPHAAASRAAAGRRLAHLVRRQVLKRRNMEVCV